jgi:hypothetical protein
MIVGFEKLYRVEKMVEVVLLSGVTWGQRVLRRWCPSVDEVHELVEL